MKILGIDTTTKFLCLGIYDNGKIYEYNLEVERRLSILLAKTIKRVLDTLGWNPKDIDYFACGLGPGSFTGVRTGLATVKGLSFSLNKPLIGICTLDILAENAKGKQDTIIPIIDAKRNLIYCSVYKNKNGRLIRAKPHMLLDERQLFKLIKPNSVILADGLNLYKEKILKYAGRITILDKDYWYPKAYNIIQLALERIKKKEFADTFKVKPIYLYPKECQITK
jgi:tRNA threonylcarbamoyl adenosine modification protein YeaZ